MVVTDILGEFIRSELMPSQGEKKAAEDKKTAEDKKASAFFNAVVRAGKVNELDSTVLEYCEGDYDKAAKMLGISLDI